MFTLLRMVINRNRGYPELISLMLVNEDETIVPHSLLKSVMMLDNLQERLKHYEKKIGKLESADYLARHQPSVRLNIAATNRFIDNALPSLNADQKEALRKVSKALYFFWSHCSLA